MKFGLRYASLGRFRNGPAAVELAQAAEAAGFDSIWTVEHVVVPHGYQSRYPYSPSGRMGSGLEDFPIPDPLIWLAYVASATRTHQARHRDPDPAPAQPGRDREGGGHARSYGRRAAACSSASGWAGSPRSSPRSACRSTTAAPAPTSTWRRCARCGARSARRSRAASSRSSRCSAGPGRPGTASRSWWAATRWRRPAAPDGWATGTFPRGPRRPVCSTRCGAPRRRPGATQDHRDHGGRAGRSRGDRGPGAPGHRARRGAGERRGRPARAGQDARGRPALRQGRDRPVRVAAGVSAG